MTPDLEVSLAGACAVWVHRCTRCGFGQVRPRLPSDLLPTLYAADYFDSAVAIGYGDYARQALRRRREAWYLSRWLRRHPPHGPVLEVGCALGFLLAALRDAGHDVVGLDVSRFAAYYARTRLALDVRPLTLEEARLPDGSFAAVVQKDLLEHVVDPRRHLLETRRVLRPGGWLSLVTPCGEANLRPLRALARTLDAGMLPLIDQGHLSFFAPQHLHRLFDECGFDVVRARTIGVRRGLRALGWLPGQARFQRTARRDAQTLGRRAAAPADAEARFQSLARQIEGEVARHHRWILRSPAYYLLHRAFKLLDELPGAVAAGYDFEFLLRRR